VSNNVEKHFEIDIYLHTLYFLTKLAFSLLVCQIIYRLADSNIHFYFKCVVDMDGHKH